jgi:ribosomal-protein-alanine N-acetyltransferase
MNRLKAFKKFPELKTNRLVLREFTMKDAEWYLRHFSTREIFESSGFPAPNGIKCARAELKEYMVDLFKERNGFRWGIEAKDEGKLIGSVGFYKWAKPSGHMAEMGYDLDPKYWHRGIMAEAMHTVIDFGFKRMKLNRIYVTIMPRNRRSLKLVKRLGFTKEGVLRESGLDENMKPTDEVIYSLLKRDWAKARSQSKG